MRFQDIKHIYVLDNGNGNVMAYMIDPHSAKPEAVPLMNANGEPAGFARKPNGGMLVGTQLVGTDFEIFADCHFTATSFKAVPNSDNRDVMLQYLRAWHNKLAKSKGSHIGDDGNNAVWIIGCPTGWTDPSVIRNYQKLFLDAGFANPIVIPESDAAISHARKVSSDIDQMAVRSGVLCQDFGAYSNDSTYISAAGIQSYGGFVGAGIIDKMIVQLNLNRIEEFVSKKGNSPFLVEAVRRRVQNDPVFRDFMFLQGRWLKEKYFESKKDGTLSAKGVSTFVTLDEDPSFDGMDQFRLFLNSQMVHFILEEQKICEMLGEPLFAALPVETRQEIGQKTWKSCLETFLQNTAKAIPDFQKRAVGSKGNPPIVLITGGAAEMDIIENTIWDSYPNVSVVSDPTPRLSIARGLADIALEKISKCTPQTEITQASFYNFGCDDSGDGVGRTEKPGKNTDSASGKKGTASDKQGEASRKQGTASGKQNPSPKKSASVFTWSLSHSLQKENVLIGYVTETGKDPSSGKGYVDVCFSGSAAADTFYVYRHGIWLQTFSASGNSISVSADKPLRLNNENEPMLKIGDVLTVKYFSSAHRITAQRKDNTISVQSQTVRWLIPGELKSRLIGYVMRADDQDADIVLNRQTAKIEKFWVYRDGVLLCEVTGNLSGTDSEISVVQLKKEPLKVGDLIVESQFEADKLVTAYFSRNNCSISVKNLRNPAIILKRDKKLVGSGRDYFIRIDGALYIVKNNSYQKVYVTPGRHHIELGNMNVLNTAPSESEKKAYRAYDLEFPIGRALELDFTNCIADSRWVNA